MADPFVAEIRIFPFNFAPKGWAWCDGQLLPISQNTALFSLLGTTYGGNGKSNFGLPDLQGRAPMHPGQGPGLSLHDLGSPYAHVLDAVAALLPPLSVTDRTEVARLAKDGPPEEAVGLEPYGPPEAMPSGARA